MYADNEKMKVPKPPDEFGGDDFYARDISMQRGGGVGSIFSSIYSSVVPLVRSALKSQVGQSLLKDAKSTAVRAGLDVVGDALDGENVLESTKRHMKQARSDFGRKINKRLEAGSTAFANPRRLSKKLKKTEASKKRKRKVPMRRSMTAPKTRKALKQANADLFN